MGEEEAKALWIIVDISRPFIISSAATKGMIIYSWCMLAVHNLLEWKLDVLTPQLRKSPLWQLISKLCDEWERIYCQLAGSTSNKLMMQVCSLCRGPQLCLNSDSVHKASSLFSKHTELIRWWSEQMFAKLALIGCRRFRVWSGETVWGGMMKKEDITRLQCWILSFVLHIFNSRI